MQQVLERKLRFKQDFLCRAFTSSRLILRASAQYLGNHPGHISECLALTFDSHCFAEADGI